MASVRITACDSADTDSLTYPGEHWVVTADVVDQDGSVFRSVTHEFESGYPASEILGAIAQRIRDGYGGGIGAEIVGQEVTL
jgi:hypothetical protein